MISERFQKWWERFPQNITAYVLCMSKLPHEICIFFSPSYHSYLTENVIKLFHYKKKIRICLISKKNYIIYIYMYSLKIQQFRCKWIFARTITYLLFYNNHINYFMSPLLFLTVPKIALNAVFIAHNYHKTFMYYSDLCHHIIPFVLTPKPRIFMRI